MLLMICSEACWNYYAWKRVFWSLVLAVCSANLAKLGSFRNICLKSALSVKKWLSFHSKLLHFAVWQYDECSTSHRLDVPPTHLSTVGRCVFPVSGATVWNDLPLYVASASSLAVFRLRFKTFLFSRSYQETVIWLVCYYHHSSLLSGHLWSLQ